MQPTIIGRMADVISSTVESSKHLLEIDREKSINLNSKRSFATVRICGVLFNSMKIHEAIEAIAQFIAQKEPQQVCLSNAYTVALCQKDPHFLKVTNNAALVLADGMSIVWGARWIGLQLPERLAGPDIMEALCAQAMKAQHGIFLLGSSWENLARLKEVLLLRWPTLRIVGMYSPPMCEQLDEKQNSTILRLLEETTPDLLFVGMSAPKQEKWIAENLKRHNIPVSIGVGAAFDFLSGRIPRAPKLLQNIGLEWLYRLYREPRRLWKRYLLGNLLFLLLLMREAFRNRFLPEPDTSVG